VNATTTGWVGDIQTLTLDNTNFRTVLFTGPNLQLTVMCLATGEEIGVEMHDHLDQFIRVESGSARVTLGPSATEVAVAHEIADDWAMIIPGGTWHNVINTGATELRLYSLYAPAEHPDGTVHVTKDDADAARSAEHHDEP
jgi:mannose-6-phosphate isomerase-like protein (cupin superfamily)